MGLFHETLRRFAAQFVEPHDVITGGCAQGLTGLACLELHHEVRQHRGDLRAAPPTERTALEGRLAVGVGDGELGEILTGACPATDILGASRGFLELLRRGVLRHRDEDVREVVLVGFGGTVLVLRDELFDLTRGDVDALQYIALPQHLGRHLAAHALPVCAVVDALRGERLGQVGEGDAVALRDIGERGIERLVVDTDAGALRTLHLDLLQHQTVEHLLAQHGGGRHLHALAADALRDLGDLFIEFAAEHHAVVDHGSDPIEHLAPVRERARLGMGASARERQRQSQG